MGMLRQKDTFLFSGKHRLKLREEHGAGAELIWYARPDRGTVRGRWSAFVRIPVSSPEAFLRQYPMPERRRLVVSKQRHLFLYRNARIHLDAVSTLGHFIEFEVRLERGERQARNLLHKLSEAFGIRKKDIIAGAYADMLSRRLQA